MLGRILFYFMNGPFVLLTRIAVYWKYMFFYISFLLPKSHQKVYDQLNAQSFLEQLQDAGIKLKDEE